MSDTIKHLGIVENINGLWRDFDGDEGGMVGFLHPFPAVDGSLVSLYGPDGWR